MSNCRISSEDYFMSQAQGSKDNEAQQRVTFAKQIDALILKEEMGQYWAIREKSYVQIYNERTHSVEGENQFTLTSIQLYTRSKSRIMRL